MSITTRALVGLLGVIGITAAAVVALSDTPKPKPLSAATSPFEVVQQFPSAGPAETAWKVHWGQATAKGLYITGAWFKPGPKEEWMKVVGDTRLSDIFVPYHGHHYAGMEKTRFWDLSNFQFNLLGATRQDAGPRGELLGDPPVVVKEVRERGVIWKDHLIGVTKRGEELVLWGTLKAGNYAYIMQYSFRDDGTMSCRLGATARNYPQAPLETHVHNALWRVDVDVDGPEHNSVLLMRHHSPKSRSTPLQSDDSHELFNGGKEGWADWVPEEFTMLEVINTKRLNAMGEHMGYDLMPLRHGTSRHYGGEYEQCTLHDFYVTRSPHADSKPDDELDFKLLPTKYVNGQSIVDTDVVLWYISSMHHEPRSEDGKLVKDKNGNFRWRGATLVMWGGFDLIPRNLFEGTPFYPYQESE